MVRKERLSGPSSMTFVLNDTSTWAKSQHELVLNTGCFDQMQIFYIFQYEQMWSAASSLCERIPVSPPVWMLASLNTNAHTWCEESWGSSGWGSVASCKDAESITVTDTRNWNVRRLTKTHYHKFHEEPSSAIMQGTRETLRWRSGEELKKRDGSKRLDGPFVPSWEGKLFTPLPIMWHLASLCDAGRWL